ncbi:histone-lysine N-methyltransferase, H3 lysine-9 specific SUVH6-like [Chenopodium quinoa]|uniref:Uncharacterized protein n=1 Tax=Chenopodium quinoa TaxID=63459 RepID=A0A803LUF7_CHEQI|nr:histone-lysine N-methyltransferase, H3 lysine-9 specific SUVH6-like [Chenopodium quinoa]
MSPMIDEDMLLDILDNSLLISPPEYGMQNILGNCDFPNGYGTISPQNSMLSNCEQIEGDDWRKGGTLREAERQSVSEESESHDLPVCPNGAELPASSLVKLERVEDGYEELPKMPVMNPKLPSAVKHEVMDEAALVQPCLLPSPRISPNRGRNGQRCASQKRVSPVCDIRRRKMPRLVETQDKHLGECETVSDIHEAVVNNINQIGEQPDDNVLQDKIQEDAVLGNSGDVVEDPFDSQKSASVHMNMQPPLFSKLSKNKGRDNLCEESNCEQGKGMKQSDGNGKQKTFSIKKRNKKKTSAGLSCSNTKVVEGRNTGVENERGMSMVQGPKSVPNPLREGKEGVETSQSMAGVKMKEGMKHGCVMSNKGNCLSNTSDARRKVRDTLRLFHGVLRKLVQADENKAKGRVDASIQISAALKIFKDHGKYTSAKKTLGHVPGVEVGDLFTYRVELDIIGLHKPLQSGIDFIKLDTKLVAISVVASGRYDNVVDNSDVLIYVGQGGNIAGGCKQLEDQKLLGGNLALKNSIDKKNPVRVVRGFKERKTIRGKRVTIPTYIYDGLYTAERCWQECGPHGKLIYKFELRRIPHQQELTWKKLEKVKKSKNSKAQKVQVEDISKGKEETPIFAVNTIDDEKPLPFTYITSVMYPDWCRPLPPKGCDCKDGCSDSEHCACALKNGGEIPYNYSGALVEEKPLIYECGPSCKCPPTCHNRVSQHGIKLPLEVFKTESRGWGVRSLSSIPSGSFVCEYIGEILDEKEAEQRIDDDEYLFDIGRNYNDPTLRDRLSALMPDMPSKFSAIVENVGFTIDAAKFGNIGRFINHSCSPNLVAQNVLYDHEDKRIPHIMLFASENIPPFQELSYHYNYTIDQVLDSKGNVRKKICYCGSADCTGRMY